MIDKCVEWGRAAGLVGGWGGIGPQELHFDMNEDKGATTRRECLILPSLSGDSGQTPACPQLGIHTHGERGQHPLVINIGVSKPKHPFF